LAALADSRAILFTATPMKNAETPGPDGMEKPVHENAPSERQHRCDGRARCEVDFLDNKGE